MVLFYLQFISRRSDGKPCCSTDGSGSHVRAHEGDLQSRVARCVSFGSLHNVRRFAYESGVYERGAVFSYCVAAKTKATPTSHSEKGSFFVDYHLGSSLPSWHIWFNSWKRDKVVFNTGPYRTGRLLRSHINQLWNTTAKNKNAFQSALRENSSSKRVS